jgi:hypothetical protein
MRPGRGIGGAVGDSVEQHRRLGEGAALGDTAGDTGALVAGIELGRVAGGEGVHGVSASPYNSSAIRPCERWATLRASMPRS